MSGSFHTKPYTAPENDKEWSQRIVKEWRHGVTPACKLHSYIDKYVTSMVAVRDGVYVDDPGPGAGYRFDLVRKDIGELHKKAMEAAKVFLADEVGSDPDGQLVLALKTFIKDNNRR